MRRRILYLQFTNPGGYPPLDHGSRILADRGWSVTFLGTGAFGAADRLSLSPHARIRVYRMPYFDSRLARKISYVVYCMWAAAVSIVLRPRWIYASDPLSCLPALVCSRMTASALIYHEHDSPVGMGHESRSLVARCRRRVAKTASACVLPNADRAHSFVSDTNTPQPVVCAWNCPPTADAEPEKPPIVGGQMLVFYHGSLSRDLLPFSVLAAMRSLPEQVHLEFAGYGTVGAPHYAEEFLAEAARLGIGDRVRYLGARDRRELLDLCRRAAVGLALMPMDSRNPNIRAMVGASNKSFDYLCCGLALLVSDLPEWRATFVDAGYALACDPSDPDTIARALAWFHARPEETAHLGQRGRRRIREEWNYEHQFAPVLERIERR